MWTTSLKPHFFLALAIGAVVLTGCSKSTESPQPVTGTIPNDLRQVAVARYADQLIAAHGDLLLQRDIPMQTLADPNVAYLVKFTVKRSTWLTKTLRFEGDEETRDQNLVISEAWGRLFCTTELIALVKEHGLMVVYGEIIDGRGQRHSLASCFKTSSAKSINDRERISESLN